jgi:hypothetical protein
MVRDRWGTRGRTHSYRSRSHVNVDSARGGWGADGRMPGLILSALGAAWLVDMHTLCIG